MIWPHWYAQACAWAVAGSALGLALAGAGTLIGPGARKLWNALTWTPTYADWMRTVWLPRWQAAEKRRKGARRL